MVHRTWLRALARGALALAVLLGAAVSGARDASAAVVAREWQDLVGVETRDLGIQGNAFLAPELWINVGDSVTWAQNAEEIHTVSFLSGGERPPLIIAGPDFNPVALFPAGGTTYNGTGFFNSGLFPAVSQSYRLTFGTAGNFPFVCLVHTNMSGTVHVRAAGTPYPHDQGFYDRQGQVLGEQILAKGLQITGLAHAENDRNDVTVGTGTAIDSATSVAAMRFIPDRRVVHAGQAVEFKNRDPETPHTVTFGTEPPGAPLGAFAPVGLDGPGHATISSTSDNVNSGFLGAGLPFGTAFSATFTNPGIYPFICALHDELGMTGEIVVVP